jgi:hypothetical protein
MSRTELWVAVGLVAGLVFFAIVAVALILDNRKLRRATSQTRVVTVGRDDIPLPPAPGSSGPQRGNAGSSGPSLASASRAGPEGPAPEARREHPTPPELRALRAELAPDMRAAGGEPELPAVLATPAPQATPAPSSARPAPHAAPRRPREPFKLPELGPYPPAAAPHVPNYALQARRPAPDADVDHERTIQDDQATSALSAYIREATSDPPPAVGPRDEAAEKAAHLHNRAAKPAPASDAKARKGTLLGGFLGLGRLEPPPPQSEPPATLPPPPSEPAQSPRPRSLFDPLDDEEEEVTHLMTKDGKAVNPKPAPQPRRGDTLVSIVAAPSVFGAERKRGG